METVNSSDHCHVVAALVACAVVLGCVSGGAVAQTTDANGSDNETVQHERPAVVGESGDLERLQRWLDGRLSQRLGSSTVALSEGEYERARETLGDDYDGRLAQYVDVAGETGENEAVAGTYRDLGDSQRDLASRAERFEAASERYERARENGDTAAAREAAREMNRLGDQVAESGANTTRGYERLADQTDADTRAERAAVTNLTDDVRERQAAVRTATFVETDLAVVDATRTISYRDPLALTGRLTASNGSALADRSVRVSVAGRPQSVRTDENGRFTLSYRPRALRVNASTVRVAYAPRNESAYLGSNASVPVDVEQVRPTVSVGDHTTETRFGESTGASVAVTVDGDPVSGVPVVADVADHRLDRSTTDSDGSARVESALPASVPAGEVDVRVAVALRDRAIGPAAESAPVSVAATGTTLNASGEHRGDGATVSGRLATDDGRPVGGQQVRLSRNGTAVATAETGPDGRYSATVPLSPDAASGDRTQVRAAFDGSGTNLESATAEATVVVTGPPGESRAGALQQYLSIPLPWPVAAGAALVLALAGGAVWRRRADRGADVDEDDGGSAASAPPTEADSGADTGPDAPSAIERAETFLERGAAGAAVRAAYAAIRERYARDAAPGTHAEFSATVDSLDDADRRAVERVTEAYEREAFAPGSVDEGGARAAIDAASALVDRRS